MFFSPPNQTVPYSLFLRFRTRLCKRGSAQLDSKLQFEGRVLAARFSTKAVYLYKALPRAFEVPEPWCANSFREGIGILRFVQKEQRELWVLSTGWGNAERG